MSKKSMSNEAVSSSKMGKMGYGEGYVLGENARNQIIGQILTLFEAMGLSEKQFEAASSLVRRAVWDEFSNGVFISSKRHSEIRELYWKARKENNGLPLQAI